MSQVIERDATSLAERILELVRDDRIALPPFPALLARLQALLQRDDVNAEDVARTIRVDPGLVANLLQVANSAAFGGLQRIIDLQQVIARLGLRQVGSMITALQVKGQFTAAHGPNTELTRTLWDHSVTCAFAARRLADQVSADLGQAFLAGLLHDCGNLLVLRALDHLEETGELELAPTDALRREMMERLHCELGHSALVAWNLPEPLPTLVLRHEDPPEAGDDPLLSCLQAADLITRKLGFDLAPLPELSLLQEPAIENLSIDDVGLATLMVDMEDYLEELRSVF